MDIFYSHIPPSGPMMLSKAGWPSFGTVQANYTHPYGKENEIK